MILLHSVHFHIYALFALACVRVPVRFAFECFTRSHISGVLVVIEACRRLGNHPRTAHIYTHQSRCCALISGLRLSRCLGPLTAQSSQIQYELRAHSWARVLIVGRLFFLQSPVVLFAVGLRKIRIHNKTGSRDAWNGIIKRTNVRAWVLFIRFFTTKKAPVPVLFWELF